MIVAGIGCRKGSSADAVAGTIGHALAAYGLTLEAVGGLATGGIKRNEPGILDAARKLGLPLEIVGEDDLAGMAARCLTHSRHSLNATGAPSLSEAAALAVAGPASRLLGPRIVQDGVTCALARSGGKT